ncbi:hypothetical protein ACHAWF_008141 [Thalassiosira exigua]
MPEFKLILIGDCDEEKTAFVKCFMGNNDVKACSGAKMYPLVFRTNRGPIKFNIWDTSGKRSLGACVTGTIFMHNMPSSCAMPLSTKMRQTGTITSLASVTIFIFVVGVKVDAKLIFFGLGHHGGDVSNSQSLELYEGRRPSSVATPSSCTWRLPCC